jgi:hypothetical protein
MSVSKKYEALVSKRVMKEQNYPGHILTLTDRPIFTPEQESFWPARTTFTGTEEIHSEGENNYECKWCRALNYE